MAFVSADNIIARQRAMEQQQLAEGIERGVQNFSNSYDRAQERKRAMQQQAKQDEILKQQQNIADVNLYTNLSDKYQGVSPEMIPMLRASGVGGLNNLTQKPFAETSEGQKFQAQKQYESEIKNTDREADFKNKSTLLDKEYKLKGELEGAKVKNKPNQYDLENKTTITKLSGKNADANAIANTLDSYIANVPTYNEDQILTQGKQLIKTLNSQQGQDAVGAEEAKRLAGKLEFSMGNFLNSNPTQFGRDLPGFIQQVKDTSENLKNTISRNKTLIDQAKGKPLQNQKASSLSEGVIVHHSDGKTYQIKNGQPIEVKP